MVAEDYLQELTHTNFYRFESLTGLGFSSSTASDSFSIDRPSSWWDDILASDQLAYLEPPFAFDLTSTSSSPSSQVTMDEDRSPGYPNSPMKLQDRMLLANSFTKISDTQQQEPWYETNLTKEGCYASASTDHQSYLRKSVQRQTKTTAAKRKIQEMKKSEHDNKKRLRNEKISRAPLSSDNKVGKEKMGDRIATLQRLVSPFGKSDTASVLSECIEYIKFLHEQVSVLSTPYGSKNGAEVQYFQDLDDCFHDQCVSLSVSETGLRSRGLGIVPVSSALWLTHNLAIDSESNNLQN